MKLPQKKKRLNVLNAIQQVSEVCLIYCATANPTKVVVAESSFGKEKGRGILGVIDGFMPKGVETPEEVNRLIIEFISDLKK